LTRAIAAERASEVVAFYLAGGSSRETSIRFGASRTTVEKYVRMAGGTWRENYVAVSPEENLRREEALKGRTFAQAAAALGMRQDSLRQWAGTRARRGEPVDFKRVHRPPRGHGPEAMACSITHGSEKLAIEAMKWASDLARVEWTSDGEAKLRRSPEFLAFEERWGASIPSAVKLRVEAERLLASSHDPDNPLGDPAFVARIMAGVRP
jgi:hypothetical protein